MSPPLSRVLQAVLWTAVCTYAALAILAMFGARVGEFDDSLPLVGGMLVHRGLTPLRDFYAVYPPLGLYVNAFAFGLLGRTVVATRVVSAILYLLVLILAARYFRRRFPDAAPLVAASTLLFAVAIGGAASLAAWQGFSLALAGLLIYLAPRDFERSPLTVAAAGVLTGISLLYRLNFGLYVATAVLIDLGLRRKPREIAAFAAPIVVCFAGFFALIYGAGAPAVVTRLVADALHAIGVRFIVFGFSLKLAGALMFPALWCCARLWNSRKAPVAAAIAIAIPVMALAGHAHPWIPHLTVLAELAAVIFLERWARPLEHAEFVLLPFYGCCLNYFLSRADAYHWAVIPIGAAVLLPSMTPKGGAAWAFLAVALFAAVELASLQPRFYQARTGTQILADAAGMAGQSDTDAAIDADPEALEWAVLYPDRDERQAVRYLRLRSRGDDALFVGCGDHSRVYVNDLRIYWLADRPAGVRTFQLETGMATEASVQAEIIEDFHRRDVRWLIIDLEPPRGDATFVRKAYQGSTLLDEYIRQHFQPVATFGRYQVLSVP